MENLLIGFCVKYSFTKDVLYHKLANSLFMIIHYFDKKFLRSHFITFTKYISTNISYCLTKVKEIKHGNLNFLNQLFSSKYE